MGRHKDTFFSKTKKMLNKHPIVKFLCIIFILAAYFLFVAESHGLKNGLLISILTWSFFVLCTPIADAGILIDLPMRLVASIKMVYSEIIVWTVAIALNIFMFLKNPAIYDKTTLLSLFKHIISTPFPYFIIIILSGIGTFLSVYIGDSLLNPKKRKKKHLNFLMKHKIIIFASLTVIIIVCYKFLLNKLGVNIPLL